MGNDQAVRKYECGAEHLTGRQAEILCLIAAGLTAGQAAQRLSVATSTVEDHLRVMRERTRTRNSVELAARAFAAGILVPGLWPPRLSGHRCLLAEEGHTAAPPVTGTARRPPERPQSHGHWAAAGGARARRVARADP